MLQLILINIKNITNAIDKLNEIAIDNMNLKSLKETIDVQLKSLIDNETNIIANQISDNTDNYEEKKSEVIRIITCHK